MKNYDELIAEAGRLEDEARKAIDAATDAAHIAGTLDFRDSLITCAAAIPLRRRARTLRSEAEELQPAVAAPAVTATAPQPARPSPAPATPPAVKASSLPVAIPLCVIEDAIVSGETVAAEDDEAQFDDLVEQILADNSILNQASDAQAAEDLANQILADADIGPGATSAIENAAPVMAKKEVLAAEVLVAQILAGSGLPLLAPKAGYVMPAVHSAPTATGSADAEAFVTQFLADAGIKQTS